MNNTSILLNEELQRKIRENEILHTELSNVKEDTTRQMMLVVILFRSCPISCNSSLCSRVVFYHTIILSVQELSYLMQ